MNSPFCGNWVVLQEWKTTIKSLESQAKEWHKNDDVQKILDDHLNHRLRELKPEFDAIESIIKLSRDHTSNKYIEDLKNHNKECINQLYQHHWQILMRDKIEERWPEDLVRYVYEEKKIKDNQEYIRDPESGKGFTYSVINIPIILALKSFSGLRSAWLENPRNISALRNYRDFHRDWFENIYWLTIVNLVHDDRIK